MNMIGDSTVPDYLLLDSQNAETNLKLGLRQVRKSSRETR